MKPTRLVAQFLAWAVGIFCLNVAVERVSRTSIPRQMARRIDQSPRITDLFAGNSLMAAGFEAEPFERACPGRRVLNIGLGSSSPVEHDILLRRSLRLEPNRVYYGFFDAQLIDPMPGEWGDLVGNRAMAYYLDLEVAIRFYAAEDPLRAGLMRVVSLMPMVVERYAIWARVEKLRRRLSGIGYPTGPSNRFGRAEDFRLLEFADAAEFRRACQSAVDDRKPLIPPVLDMLRIAREHKIKLTVVEMPMTSDHRRRFYDQPEWARLRRSLEDQVRREGGSYLVASDWVGDDGFADHLHLNAKGAAQFSRRIAMTEVTRAGPLPSASLAFRGRLGEPAMLFGEPGLLEGIVDRGEVRVQFSALGQGRKGGLE